jgi:hypothetical protein
MIHTRKRVCRNRLSTGLVLEYFSGDDIARYSVKPEKVYADIGQINKFREQVIRLPISQNDIVFKLFILDPSST